VETESAAQGGRTEGGDMLRRNQLIGAAALALACSLPASAAVAQQDLRSPDSRDAAGVAAPIERPAEPGQDLRLPDARDAARDLPPVHVPAPIVEIRQVPSDGFDWGDAGIGAAGMLALFSIAAGSTVLVTNRRRRRGFQVATR
jgi:hypothetical protein